MKGVNIPCITMTSARNYIPVNDIREHEIVAPADSEEGEFVTHEDWDALKVQKPDPGKVSGDKQTREAVKVIDQYMDTLQ